MQAPSSDIKALFDQAMDYDRQGDPYNAIKLYKRLTKLAPDWAPPYVRLGNLYKYRKEWKPALHYCKKTVVLEPGHQLAWRTIGIAATALKKWRMARRVWKKFGFDPQQRPQNPVSVRLQYEGQFEILWARPVDPARALIENIPHPASGRRYHDLVLYDSIIAGYQVTGNRRFPVYDELGLFKPSVFHTFSCLLHTNTPDAIGALERICREAGLGFENWSNAARTRTGIRQNHLPEYYSPDLSPRQESGGTIAAIAAPSQEDVLRALASWKVITLQSYSDLECHL